MNKTLLTLAACATWLGFTAFSCAGAKKGAAPTNSAAQTVSVPTFEADSAYAYVSAQVNFGPRVPNSKGHSACNAYLQQKLKECGATVTAQRADLVAYDGTLLKCTNIIGSFAPEKKKRIALFAHWDTRPWADHDENKQHRHTPIPGANDGASGVGVLLEIARQLGKQPAELGIDIILLDAEDYGAPEFYSGQHEERFWCLGAQHWAKNPHTEGYNARFGLLLDMVGGKNATFLREGYSDEFARGVNDKIFVTAHRLGYANMFINKGGSYITDDHVFVNRLAGIKTIDIIAYDEVNGFPKNWHTLNDNMEHIDPQTLKAVGQTVLDVIYREQ